MTRGPSDCPGGAHGEERDTWEPGVPLDDGARVGGSPRIVLTRVTPTQSSRCASRLAPRASSARNLLLICFLIERQYRLP